MTLPSGNRNGTHHVYCGYVKLFLHACQLTRNRTFLNVAARFVWRQGEPHPVISWNSKIERLDIFTCTRLLLPR